MYADDTQLYKSVPFSDLQLLVQSIETCFCNVKIWMTDNKLKMNSEKTEILLCGPKKYLESSDCDHIWVKGENISFSDNARNLGVYFDCTFSMEHHVKQLCKSLFFELRKISHMRAFLNEASLQKLVTSFVLSRMDYCNSLLVNLPNDTITKLQRIQNHVARLVLKKAKRDHVTPLFRKLHWLPLQTRINYNICVLCFQCINKTAPSYLSDLLDQYVPLMFNLGCPKAQYLAQFCILCTQHHLARSLKNTTSTIICMLMTLSCINLSLFQIFNF